VHGAPSELEFCPPPFQSRSFVSDKRWLGIPRDGALPPPNEESELARFSFFHTFGRRPLIPLFPCASAGRIHEPSPVFNSLNRCGRAGRRLFVPRPPSSLEFRVREMLFDAGFCLVTCSSSTSYSIAHPFLRPLPTPIG